MKSIKSSLNKAWFSRWNVAFEGVGPLGIHMNIEGMASGDPPRQLPLLTTQLEVNRSSSFESLDGRLALYTTCFKLDTILPYWKLKLLCFTFTSGTMIVWNILFPVWYLAFSHLFAPRWEIESCNARSAMPVLPPSKRSVKKIAPKGFNTKSLGV